MNSADHENITAVILAGGMGRRMNGLDKGLVELNGRPMISYVIDVMKPNVHQVLINANRNLEEYGNLGVDVVTDSSEGFQGPLAGFEAGISRAKTPWVFTCPCDSPIQSTQLLPTMWQHIKGSDANIGLAYDGERTHPVFSLLKTSLLPSLREYLAAGDRKIDRWFAQHKLCLLYTSPSPRD